MSQLHTEYDQIQTDNAPEIARTIVRPVRAPLVSRLIDPSNVVFSLVFCQQTRREFDMGQPG